MMTQAEIEDQKQRNGHAWKMIVSVLMYRLGVKKIELTEEDVVKILATHCGVSIIATDQGVIVSLNPHEDVH